MYLGSRGYSTLLVATLLFAFVIVSGGLYYLQAKARMALLPRKQLMYPSINPPHNGSDDLSEEESKYCPILEKNPDLYTRFLQTQAFSCGEKTKENKSDSVAALKLCIEKALAQCFETKTYLYVEQNAGYSEYLITTHDCEMFIDSWSTASPQCGVKYDSCKKLAADFPASMCYGPVKNIPLPTKSNVNVVSPNAALRPTISPQ